MALIGANELKKKMLIEVDGQPFNVLDVFFATPTARGASTMVRTGRATPDATSRGRRTGAASGSGSSRSSYGWKLPAACMIAPCGPDRSTATASIPTTQVPGAQRG